MLPTQPLLPSQIKGLITSHKPAPIKPQPKQPKAKTKKESMKSKVQKLEANLKLQNLLGYVDRTYPTSNLHENVESDLETDFLNTIENISRGDQITGKDISLQENYYKNHKVARYLQLNWSSETDVEDDYGEFEDSHMLNLMRLHVNKKKRKQKIINNEEDMDSN